MYRFFTDNESINGSRIVITGADVHHLKDVLRLGIGDLISVCTGDEWEYTCRISDVGTKLVLAQIEDDYFLVEADWFPKVLKGIDTEDYEALQYMQRVLEKSGIFDALRERGIQEGDIVSLYDIEFEYIP